MKHYNFGTSPKMRQLQLIPWKITCFAFYVIPISTFIFLIKDQILLIISTYASFVAQRWWCSSKTTEHWWCIATCKMKPQVRKILVPYNSCLLQVYSTCFSQHLQLPENFFMLFSTSRALWGYDLSFLATLPRQRGQCVPLSLTAVRKHFLQNLNQN